MYLNGSQSPFLSRGKAILEDVASKYNDTLLGAKIVTVIARAEARDFFRIKNRRNSVLVKTHSADPKKALDLTASALDVYRKANQKELNLLYHELGTETELTIC